MRRRPAVGSNVAAWVKPGPEVVVLRVEPVEPRDLLRSSHGAFGPMRQVEAPVEVGGDRLVELAGVLEASHPVGPQRLEHPEP